MNSKEIFALALNLESPWYIKDVGLKKEKNDPIGYLTIEIDFKKGAKFLMEDGQSYTAYDTEIKKWQHLNFFEHKCYIVARVPRVKMKNSKVRMVQVPWARQGSGFTLLFEAYSMLLIEQEMPVNKVSRTIRVTAPRIWRIFDYWIKKAVAKDDVSEVEQIGIDETSSKKGHNYVTVTVDLGNKRVIHAGEGKDNTTIENMKKELQPKGLKPENIQNISIDMSPAFIQGINENFADSKIVFDRFHIKKI
jgi:transposase